MSFISKARAAEPLTKGEFEKYRRQIIDADDRTRKTARDLDYYLKGNVFIEEDVKQLQELTASHEDTLKRLIIEVSRLRELTKDR